MRKKNRISYFWISRCQARTVPCPAGNYAACKPASGGFATAYDEYALQAFEENAVDYILKPLSSERLEKSIKRIRCLVYANCEEKVDLPDMNALLDTMGLGTKVLRISVEAMRTNFAAGAIRRNPLPGRGPQNNDLHAKRRFSPAMAIRPLINWKNACKGSLFPHQQGRNGKPDPCSRFAPWFNGKYVVTMKHIDEQEIIISKGRVKDFRQRLGLA